MEKPLLTHHPIRAETEEGLHIHPRNFFSSQLQIRRTHGSSPEAQDENESEGRALVALLKTCADKNDLNKGRIIHSEITQKGILQHNVYLGTALVSLYAKCGDLRKAREVFDELPRRNVVTWNAMLSAYLEGGYAEKAFQLFVEMQDEDGLLPYYLTIVIILQACTFIAEKWKDKEIFG